MKYHPLSAGIHRRCDLATSAVVRHGSVIEEEFLRVEDRPQDVLVALALRCDGVERLALGVLARLVEMRACE